jgi:hypothetical protein
MIQAEPLQAESLQAESLQAESLQAESLEVQCEPKSRRSFNLANKNRTNIRTICQGFHLSEGESEKSKQKSERVN